MKQRIVYIDNLKALAIFTVVIGHVFYFTWNKYNDNVWNNFISVYNMPLFFFLSGMFAKEGLSLKHIGRKAKQLLIPTATIGVRMHISIMVYMIIYLGGHILVIGFCQHCL